ncbi:MAG TPA: hypothetical protein DCL21_05395 [Alphaproteobacteria bacterium]|nr:hypothetical protein [Alphaproteobacteria bacterium]
MFYKKINLLILLAFIAGCTIKYEKVEEPQVNLKSSYGIWNSEDCKLQANRGEIKLTLTDLYVENKARLLIESEINLAKTPTINIFGFEDYDFEILGHGKVYSLELPINTLDQARMYMNQTFLQVRYMADGTDYYRKAIFSLQDLPDGILDIKKTCT